MTVTQYASPATINVKDFGATITSAVVVKAMNALPSTGGTLLFPAGSHTCDIEITKHGVIIQGVGPRATKITGDVTWNTSAAGEGFGDFPGYYAFRDLQIIGTVGVSGDEIPYWLEMNNCIFDNQTNGYAWNIDMQGVDGNDVGQNWLITHCQFRQGGVRLRSVNTATFIRCRFGWSTQDAAIWLERSQADSATEACSAEFIGCVIEGNDKTGVYLGPGSQRCVFQSCHFEGNQAAGGTGYGDIDIADFTAVSGWHEFRYNSFNASTSDYNIRFPSPTTYNPPCIIEGNFFLNTPLHSGKHIKLQNYLGLIDQGGNRFQSTRAAAFDNPGKVRHSGRNTFSGALEAIDRFTGTIRLHDDSDATLVDLVTGTGSKGGLAFGNGFQLYGSGTGTRAKTEHKVQILGGLTIPTKAGTPTDSDPVSGASVGDMIYDTTNHKLYVRDPGGSWLSTTLS